MSQVPAPAIRRCQVRIVCHRPDTAGDPATPARTETGTSAGRVLLLDATPASSTSRFPALADDRPRSEVHSLPELWAKIRQTRRDGYARVREEFEAGLVGVSAPIRDFRGRVVAALNISAPAERLGERLDTAGRVTAKAAAKVSAHLGWEDGHRCGVVIFSGSTTSTFGRPSVD
jgi:Bacterial transcriptional regulator